MPHRYWAKVTLVVPLVYIIGILFTRTFMKLFKLPSEIMWITSWYLLMTSGNYWLLLYMHCFTQDEKLMTKTYKHYHNTHFCINIFNHKKIKSIVKHLCKSSLYQTVAQVLWSAIKPVGMFDFQLAYVWFDARCTYM